jgi:polyphosphate kinase 2 (PPK2 family)
LAPKKKNSREPAARENGIVLVRPGDEIRLAKIDPGATAGYSKADAAEKIEGLRARLAKLQEALYAEHQRSLLIVIQAMDTGARMARSRIFVSGSTRTACS